MELNVAIEQRSKSVVSQDEAALSMDAETRLEKRYMQDTLGNSVISG